MALNLSLSLDGDVQLNRTLLAVSERAIDFRPAWHRITDKLLGWEARQFASEGAFGGSKWPDLRPATKARRKALGYPTGPILDMTGALKRSLSVKGAAGQVSVITPSGMAFGTAVEYAGFHQNGTAPRARTSSTAFGPQMGLRVRKPLNLPGAAREDIVKTAQRWWVRGELA